MTALPNLSAHAHMRWQQRMEGLVYSEEWATSKPISKSLRRTLNAGSVPNDWDRKSEFRVSANGVVFVLSVDMTKVITVFFAKASKRRSRALRRERREMHYGGYTSSSPA